MIYEYLINKSLGNQWRIVKAKPSEQMFYLSMGNSPRLLPFPIGKILPMIESQNKGLYKRIVKKYPELFL